MIWYCDDCQAHSSLPVKEVEGGYKGQYHRCPICEALINARLHPVNYRGYVVIAHEILRNILPK